MRLFHFSEDPGIARFVPRPVAVPSARPPGREWLNGPLVWAVDEPRQGMYLFPRDCPRILLWRLQDTTAEDLQRWWGDPGAAMLAHIERTWLDRLQSARLCRYELPPAAFEDLHDAGMWVSRAPVEPLDVQILDDLPTALGDAGVELRVMDSLAPLRGVWSTSLHASGVRLRNAVGWTSPRPPAIRLARREDADLLPPVERSAAALFASLPDLAWVAEAPPTGADFYRPHIAAGRVWVAEDEFAGLVGVLAAEAFGPELHLWEVAVDRRFQRRGLGRRLIEAAADHARAAGLTALTLTTFRDVPWNEPLYCRLGFERLEGAGVRERLSGILGGEAQRGLPTDRRCAMRRRL